MKSLEKGNHQVSGVLSPDLHHHQDDSDRDADQELKHQFASTGQTEITMMNDLQVVVCKSDGGKENRGEGDDPDVLVRKIGPEQSWDNDGNRDQHSTHCGRACLLLVGRRTLLPDKLPDLKFTQLPDNGRADY